MNAQSQTLTVVCHVRAPLLLEPVDSQVESLRACEDEGRIDDLLVRSWPKEVSRSGESPYQEVLETHERLQRWADRHEVSLSPPFRTRTTTSQITDETEDVLVTPLLCLEYYRGDELVGVYPHTTGEETITTEDVIARIRCGDDSASAAEALAKLTPDSAGSPGTNQTVVTGNGATEGLETESPTRSGTCPDCEGDVVDGQGLVACMDCGWIGTLAENGGYGSTILERTQHGTTDTEPESVRSVPSR
ncbi:HTH domain-containing protein [Natronococcus occultus]|uniref:Uncharacterized protein n=1 Tax=Natronococcus occultus SP4 TaxID=694430 RepID=L0JXN5_9EURY|nr:HTH domain-containing protein [Natronococcus occultus]AGB37526.1 hypothetical protein Natoc_1722 [Natronococcus occultus SP4]